MKRTLDAANEQNGGSPTLGTISKGVPVRLDLIRKNIANLLFTKDEMISEGLFNSYHPRFSEGPFTTYDPNRVPNRSDPLVSAFESEDNLNISGLGLDARSSSDSTTVLIKIPLTPTEDTLHKLHLGQITGISIEIGEEKQHLCTLHHTDGTSLNAILLCGARCIEGVSAFAEGMSTHPKILFMYLYRGMLELRDISEKGFVYFLQLEVDAAALAQHKRELGGIAGFLVRSHLQWRFFTSNMTILLPKAGSALKAWYPRYITPQTLVKQTKDSEMLMNELEPYLPDISELTDPLMIDPVRDVAAWSSRNTERFDKFCEQTSRIFKDDVPLFKLLPHQKNGIDWMLSVEELIDSEKTIKLSSAFSPISPGHPDLLVKLPKDSRAEDIHFLEDYERVHDIDMTFQGGMLCDTHGMGKKIQILGLIASAQVSDSFSRLSKGPTLLIAKEANISEWTAQIALYYPNIKYHVVNNKVAHELLTRSMTEQLDLVIVGVSYLLARSLHIYGGRPDDPLESLMSKAKAYTGNTTVFAVFPWRRLIVDTATDILTQKYSSFVYVLQFASETRWWVSPPDFNTLRGAMYAIAFLKASATHENTTICVDPHKLLKGIKKGFSRMESMLSVCYRGPASIYQLQRANMFTKMAAAVLSKLRRTSDELLLPNCNLSTLSIRMPSMMKFMMMVFSMTRLFVNAKDVKNDIFGYRAEIVDPTDSGYRLTESQKRAIAPLDLAVRRRIHNLEVLSREYEKALYVVLNPKKTDLGMQLAMDQITEKRVARFLHLAYSPLCMFSELRTGFISAETWEKGAISLRNMGNRLNKILTQIRKIKITVPDIMSRAYPLTSVETYPSINKAYYMSLISIWGWWIAEITYEVSILLMQENTTTLVCVAPSAFPSVQEAMKHLKISYIDLTTSKEWMQYRGRVYITQTEDVPAYRISKLTHIITLVGTEMSNTHWVHLARTQYDYLGQNTINVIKIVRKREEDEEKSTTLSE